MFKNWPRLSVAIGALLVAFASYAAIDYGKLNDLLSDLTNEISSELPGIVDLSLAVDTANTVLEGDLESFSVALGFGAETSKTRWTDAGAKVDSRFQVNVENVTADTTDVVVYADLTVEGEIFVAVKTFVTEFVDEECESYSDEYDTIFCDNLSDIEEIESIAELGSRFSVIYADTLKLVKSKLKEDPEDREAKEILEVLEAMKFEMSNGEISVSVESFYGDDDSFSLHNLEFLASDTAVLVGGQLKIYGWQTEELDEFRSEIVSLFRSAVEGQKDAHDQLSSMAKFYGRFAYELVVGDE
jgi:hypothetical protein